MAMIALDKVDGRAKLKVRRDPYWQRLEAGCFIGFRKMAAGSDGSWLARYRDPATAKQSWKALGDFTELPAHQRYDTARKTAEAWFVHMGRGGRNEALTVKKACERYVTHLTEDKRAKAAADAQARFKRWVYQDKLSALDLHKLARHHLLEWRRKMAGAPVVVDPYAKRPKTRERSDASVNRDMASLRAALNLALKEGAVTSDAAWRVPLTPIKNAARSRNVYLSRDQRTTLIQHAPADLATFLRGLSLVPLRPGALAALTAAHFDARLGVLTIGKDKAGQARKITLPPKTAQFFAERAKDKLPAAPLFAQASGRAWDKDAWKKPMRAAADAAGLPEAVTAYALRHATITDLITGGLDVLTVARLSGTSVAMIEKHYGHLRAEHAAAALEKLAL